ncbi:hypothetical protein AMAG_13553 [Allomyces macrogynus ATCC 38327]|uniref:Uncharacterized protein n=1 Tax=Allomyces macrogynus (strain ATCC 38327) TaxID=578462 RepID=A0A0L0T2H1_ALLM3|nr:hypothetical protein AMAG_13553 [Allomyces macrogynus ATCC 38327]|eukprot:KNE68917.1 hypothetical protein AMAG_13553 [Allomyces macrogynus ATCC 38327]
MLALVAVFLLPLLATPALADVGSPRKCTTNVDCKAKYQEFCDPQIKFCVIPTCSATNDDYACENYNSTTYCSSMSRCVNRLQLNAPCSLDLQTKHNEPCSQNLICDPRSRTCVSTMTFWAKNMAWIISLIVVLVLGTICCCFCLGCLCFKSVKGAGKLSGKLPFTNRRDQGQ